MQPINFEEEIKKIVTADPRYPAEAYFFVQEALEFTQRSLGRNKTEDKHVGGRELLSGIRNYAVKSFGPMVPTVLGEWGIHRCEDFGEIVFNMIDHNLATKTSTDSREDFRGGYDFDDAFGKPFRPSKPAAVVSKPDEAEAGLRQD
jgi:uncharacterized repeat protein (TIGR04138 family)